jgi:hypothetical protein
MTGPLTKETLNRAATTLFEGTLKDPEGSRVGDRPTPLTGLWFGKEGVGAKNPLPMGNRCPRNHRSDLCVLF